MNRGEDKREWLEFYKLLKKEKVGDVPVIEFDTILLLGQQMGVTKLEFLQLFERYITEFPPKLENSRIKQFQRLLLILNADDSIKQSELDYIRSLSIRLGLHPEGTDALLILMKDYPMGKIPLIKFDAIFSAFKN